MLLCSKSKEKYYLEYWKSKLQGKKIIGLNFSTTESYKLMKRTWTNW